MQLKRKLIFQRKFSKTQKLLEKQWLSIPMRFFCGTCSKQTKILDQAEKEFKDVVFLSYEQSKNKNIAQKLGIKFWTTIVVYKGNDEVARVVGQTD